MASPKIIPVVDLLGGACVRAIGGRRDSYLPLECQFCTAGNVEQLADHYYGLGFKTLYVADIDAISGRPGNLSAIKQIVGGGLNLWLDSGIHSIADLPPQSPSVRTVVGTETLLEITSSADAILSIDMREGKCISANEKWHGQPGWCVGRDAIALGWQEFILLEMSAVGSATGLKHLEICSRMKELSPSVMVTVGGGVSTMADVELAGHACADAVLVGTAIYDGEIP